MLTITSQYALASASTSCTTVRRGHLGRDLAHSAEIPANYLSKVLLTLRNAGLVDTMRGSGGDRLRRPANEVYLIDVVELFEEISRTKPRCFLGRTRACSDTAPCTAHSRWRDLQAAYLGFLVSTPLAAIAGKPDDVWTSPRVNLAATEAGDRPGRD